MQITVIIITSRKEGRHSIMTPTFCQEQSHILRATVGKQQASHLLWLQGHYLCSPLHPREPRPGRETEQPWVVLAPGPRAPASESGTDGH